MIIKIELEDGAKMPEYAHPGDAGMDIFANESISIEPGERKLIKTGIRMELPTGYEVQVRPKSGLAYKYGITVLNTPGTIDEQYRGEVGVILINHGSESFNVETGMKIAQLIVKPVEQAELELINKVSIDTERAEGAMGSTGK